jgi:hypothetical protein
MKPSFFNMFPLLLATALSRQIDMPTLKTLADDDWGFDFIFYYSTAAGEAALKLYKAFGFDVIGTTPKNLKSTIAGAKSSILICEISLPNPSGQGEDILDVGPLGGKWLVLSYWDDDEPEGIPISSTANTPMEFFLALTPLTLESHVWTKLFYWSSRGTTFEHPERLHTEYALIEFGSAVVIPAVDTVSLALLCSSYSLQITKIIFSETEWNLTTRSGQSRTISRSQIGKNGDLTIVTWQGMSSLDWDIELVLVTDTTSISTTKISISENPEGLQFYSSELSKKLDGKARAASQTLKVTFTGEWEKVVGSPRLVFEAPSVGDIEFVDHSGTTVSPPASINTVTRVATPLPMAEAPPPASDSDPDSKNNKGMGAGTIAAIVIGSLAAVAGLIWWFCSGNDVASV